VDNDSVAARTGVQAGDILVRLGRFKISTLDDLAALPQSASVERAGADRFNPR